VTEPSNSAVEQAVQARIAAAKVRVQAAKERRDDLAQARRYGIAHRHARKLRNLARKLTRKGPMSASDAQRGLIAGSDRRAYQETGAEAPLWPAVARYAVDSNIVSVDGDGVFSVA